MQFNQIFKYTHWHENHLVKHSESFDMAANQNLVALGVHILTSDYEQTKIVVLASQPACLPAIRPGSARCGPPYFSHKMCSHIGFTNLLIC